MKYHECIASYSRGVKEGSGWILFECLQCSYKRYVNWKTRTTDLEDAGEEDVWHLGNFQDYAFKYQS